MTKKQKNCGQYIRIAFHSETILEKPPHQHLINENITMNCIYHILCSYSRECGEGNQSTPKNYIWRISKSYNLLS